MLGMGLLPAAEHFVDGEQVEFRQPRQIFGSRVLRGDRAIEVLGDEALAVSNLVIVEL
jgi:hypothetical protein